jgi:hypothetical protein
MLLVLILMELVENRHEKEEDDNGHSHNDHYMNMRKVWNGMKMVAVKVEVKHH